MGSSKQPGRVMATRANHILLITFFREQEIFGGFCEYIAGVNVQYCPTCGMWEGKRFANQLLPKHTMQCPTPGISYSPCPHYPWHCPTFNPGVLLRIFLYTKVNREMPHSLGERHGTHPSTKPHRTRTYPVGGGGEATHGLLHNSASSSCCER